MKSLFIFLLSFILFDCTSLSDLFTHTAIEYDYGLMAEELKNFPEANWVYPDWSNYISSVSFPEPIDPTLKGVEPPLLTDVKLSSEGNILILCPINYEYLSRKGETGLHTFNIPVPIEYKLVLLDFKSGSEIWSYHLEVRGMANMLTIGKDMLLITVFDFDARGTNRSGSLYLINLKQRSVARKDRWNGPLHRFDISDNGSSLFYSYGDDVERWRSIDILSGKELWSMDVGPGEIKAITGDVIVYESDNTELYNIYHGEMLDINPRISSTNFLTSYSNYLLFSEEETLLLVDMDDLKNYLEIDIQPPRGVKFYTFSENHLLLYFERTEVSQPMSRKFKISPHKVNFMERIEEVYKEYEKVTTTFVLIDIVDGRVKWSNEYPFRVLSDVEYGDNFYFASSDSLYIVSTRNGGILNKVALPWSDPYTPVTIYNYMEQIVVESEYNVASYSKDLELNYKYQFTPLWGSISTKALTLDKRAGFWILENVLGVEMDSSWLDMVLNDESVRRSSMTKALNESNKKISISSQGVQTVKSMQKLHPGYNAATNTIVYSNQSAYLIGSSVQRFQTNMAQLSAMVQWSTEMNRQGHAAIVNNNVLSYPYISQEISRMQENDRSGVITRLTSLKGALTELTMLHLLDGSTKTVTLSPRQVPPVVDKNLSTGSYKIGIFGGYLPYLQFIHHSFRTLVDWKRGYVYHYGPGLNPAKHYNYESGNLRGQLWSFRF